MKDQDGVPGSSFLAAIWGNEPANTRSDLSVSPYLSNK